MSKRIVLVGAGHAHLHCLKHAADFAERGHELTLVAPRFFWYSGLATGVLGGRYNRELDRVDTLALARRGGVVAVCEEATSLDLAAGLIRTRRAAVPFDLASLAVGSAPCALPGESLHWDRCFAAKPIERLLALRTTLEGFFAERRTVRIVVAGGGVSAFEIAANLLGLAERRSARIRLTLFAGTQPLEGLAQGARRIVIRFLDQRGAMIEGARAAKLESGCVVDENGAISPFDLFVNATGPQPVPLAGEAGLLTDGKGGMVVDACLRSPADHRIFGAGDCIAWNRLGLAKTGAHAVRQGPVLRQNLLSAAEGGEPERFRPQRRHLAIVNLGDGTALATRGRLWWRGHSALLLKDWIDRRFLRAYVS